MDRRDDRDPLSEDEGRVLAVHFGHSSNCSSLGSVVDVLFVSSVVGTGLLAALAVLLRRPPPPSGSETPQVPSEPEDHAD